MSLIHDIDYVDPGSMFRYTFEMEIYVDPEFHNMGIGHCLVDQMIHACNPCYLSKGGYDWQVRSEYLKHGPTRTIKTINFTFPYDADDQNDAKTAEWVKNWLKKYNFRRSGHLYSMGYKFGKKVDCDIFQHITGEEISADVRPFNPL